MKRLVSRLRRSTIEPPAQLASTVVSDGHTVAESPAAAAEAAAASPSVADLPALLLSDGWASAVLPLDITRLIADLTADTGHWVAYGGVADLVILDFERNVVPRHDADAAVAGVHAIRKGGDPLAPTMPASTGPKFVSVFANQVFTAGKSYALTVSFQGYQVRNGGVLLGMGVMPRESRSGVVGWQPNSWALLTNKVTGHVEFGSSREVPQDGSITRDFDKTIGSAFGAGDTVTMLVDLTRAAVEKAESVRSSKVKREPGGRLGFVINGKFKGIAFHCLPLDTDLHAAVTLWNLHLQATLVSCDKLGAESCLDNVGLRGRYEY